MGGEKVGGHFFYKKRCHNFTKINNTIGIILKNKVMKNDYSFNDTEKLKRNWLVQIMSKYPKYELSYFSMLTDESPENRKYALIHFLTDMKDRGIKVLYRNSFERFTKNDRYNYTQQFINLYNEDD